MTENRETKQQAQQGKTMSNDNTDIQRLLIIILSAPFLWMLRALAMVDLWLWFIVPLGVVEVSMAHMYGITLVGTLVSGISTSPKSDRGALETILMSVLVSLLFWGIGAITHSCM